jgi:hypothetical protein
MVRQFILGCFFGIMLEDPSSLGHPLAKASDLVRGIVMIGAIEFAGGACERLHFAGALKPDLLIKAQPVRDVFGAASLQQNGKRKAVLNRLTGTLADVRNHGVRRIAPQGTRLTGKYDSVVAFGQKRALVVWSRLILPNGNSIVIENLPATDVAGYAGLEDQVDFHTWQLLKGVALASLIGAGTQLSIGNNQNDLVTALRQSVQQSTNQAGQRVVERELDVQPTITVRPGWPLRVIVSKDLVLKPYQDAQTTATGR